MPRDTSRYRVLFNHDGTCVFSTETPYQRTEDPVGLAQVYGYVDEVADAGCDALLLSPYWGQTIPLWDSERVPLWRGAGRTMACPDTFQGRVIRRIRDFLLAGNDFVGLTRQRCQERGLGFFLTWRMFDVHGLEHPEDPWTNDFYRANPQFRIGETLDPRWNGEISLDFSHPEVRAYQLGLIREFVERYPVDGLELDFMRNPCLFGRAIPYERRAAALREFLVEVRALLDAAGPDRPLGVRVLQRWDLTLELGLDLESWVREGLVDLVNVSSFYETSVDNDLAVYRTRLPGARIYGELTQCGSVVRAVELGLELCRKCTPEILRSTAQAFLAQGADGLSLFNFVYYRDYSFGALNKPDKFEPPFAALRGLADRAQLAGEPKHYVLARQSWFYQGQLPLDLTSPGSRHLQLALPVGQDFTHPSSREPFHATAVLRLQFEKPVAGLEVTVRRAGRLLAPCRVDGELFPTPYLEGVPTDHACTLDYELPLELLELGPNRFTLRLHRGDEAVVTRLEAAVYRKDGYCPQLHAPEAGTVQG